MKISKNDWLFIALIVAVLAVFVAISGKEKTKKVPFNDNHRSFYAMAANDGLKGQKAADQGCPKCHNEKGGIPFPAKHPVKPSAGPMSCHLCHKYDKSRFPK
jgi:cytochrome c5